MLTGSPVEATSSAMLLLISQSEHDSFSMLMWHITQTGNNSQVLALKRATQQQYILCELIFVTSFVLRICLNIQIHLYPFMVCVADLASLYPSRINSHSVFFMMSLSPDVTVHVAQGRHELKRLGELHNLLKRRCIIITSSNNT